MGSVSSVSGGYSYPLSWAGAQSTTAPANLVQGTKHHHHHQGSESSSESENSGAQGSQADTGSESDHGGESTVSFLA